MYILGEGVLAVVHTETYSWFGKKQCRMDERKLAEGFKYANLSQDA